MAREPVTATVRPPQQVLPVEQTVVDVVVRERIHRIVTSAGQIDLDDLPREVREAGGHVVWWNIVFARAKSDHRKAKVNVDVVKANIGKQLRLQHMRLQEKYTEASIAEEVNAHEDVLAVINGEIDAEERLNMVMGMQRALEEKQRTLRAYAYGVAREEMDERGGDSTARLRGETPDRRAFRR